MAPLAHAARMAAVRRRAAAAVRAVCAGPDPVHARHPRHTQGQAGAARPDHERGWQAARAVQAQQPAMGEARRDVALGDQGADRHGGPPLLRAPRHGLAAHAGLGGAHAARRSAGRLHPHPATRTQPVPDRDRPRAHAQPQAQGGDHGLQDRGALHQGRDPRDLSEHRALPLQRLRHRDGGAHLFRQTGRAADGAGKRHAGGHAQGHELLQPRAQPRPRAVPPQHGAVANGQARRAAGGRVRPAQEAPHAHQLRAPGRAPGHGPPLRAATAQMADRLGRPQRLQHLHRRLGGAHHHRLAPAELGQPGRGAPDAHAARRGQWRLEPARRLECRQPAGATTGARDPRLACRAQTRGRPRQGQGNGQGQRGRHPQGPAGRQGLHEAAARGQDPRAGRLCGAEPGHLRSAGLGGQPRLHAGRLRPRAAGTATARIHLQALCLWRRAAAGRHPRRQARGQPRGNPAGRRRSLAPPPTPRPPRAAR